MNNSLIYPAGLAGIADLDWQFVAVLSCITFSYLVLYRRHLSPAAIFNRRQRRQRELKQRLYGVPRPRVLQDAN